jgi:hypothetical protein
MSDEILIRVKVKYDDYDYSACDLHHEVVTFDQLLDQSGDYLLNTRGYSKVDFSKGEVDKKTIEFLKSKGWVHQKTVQDREERKVMEQEYYLFDELGQNFSYRTPMFSKIDIENLTEDQIAQLSKGGKIVQVVSAKSVLPDIQYKKIQDRRKHLDALKLKNKEANEKKAAAKRQKEIDKAKKILEEAGELPAKG